MAVCHSDIDQKGQRDRRRESRRRRRLQEAVAEVLRAQLLQTSGLQHGVDEMSRQNLRRVIAELLSLQKLDGWGGAQADVQGQPSVCSERSSECDRAEIYSRDKSLTTEPSCLTSSIARGHKGQWARRGHCQSFLVFMREHGGPHGLNTRTIVIDSMMLVERSGKTQTTWSYDT